jgi:hypothetical protein
MTQVGSDADPRNTFISGVERSFNLGCQSPVPETILPGPVVPADTMLRPAQQGPKQRPILS